MSALITALTEALDTEAFFYTLSQMVPLIGGLVIFAFSYRIIKKIVKGASRGKASI